MKRSENFTAFFLQDGAFFELFESFSVETDRGGVLQVFPFCTFSATNALNEQFLDQIEPFLNFLSFFQLKPTAKRPQTFFRFFHFFSH